MLLRPPQNATSVTHLLDFIMKQSGVKNYLGQTDPAGDLVGDVLPVYVSYPGAGDVLHPPATHPDLQTHTHTHTCKCELLCPNSGPKMQSHVHCPKRQRGDKRRTDSQNSGWKVGFCSEDVSERVMKTKEGKTEKDERAVNVCDANQASEGR